MHPERVHEEYLHSTRSSSVEFLVGIGPFVFWRAERCSAMSWKNHLPRWILEDPHYKSLKSNPRRVLQVMADRCDSPDEDGNLVGCFGGEPLWKEIAIGNSTFWVHKKKLVVLGFLVVLKRGRQHRHHNDANIYGIPGKRGSLSGRALTCLSNMGARQPIANRPVNGVGSTPHDCNRVVRKPDGDVVHIQDGGSPDSGHYHSDGILANGAMAPKHKNLGLGRLTVDDLSDTVRLMEIYDRAIQICWIERSEESALRFVSLAESALNWKKAENPCAIFVKNVKGNRTQFIRIDDEERAHRRLKEWRQDQGFE